MAALHLNEKEELTPSRLKKLYSHCVDNLPSYARPLFLRLEESTRVTVTFKQHKVDLVKEGFDPRVVSVSIQNTYYKFVIHDRNKIKIQSYNVPKRMFFSF
jgi:hypothetical protein